AGGGVPQWNCGCRNCQDGRLTGTGRTQSSVAVSADGARWVLLNASPDLRAQVASHPELWPRGARGTPISAVVCTDAEIDHTLGLLLLREAQAAIRDDQRHRNRVAVLGHGLARLETQADHAHGSAIR